MSQQRVLPESMDWNIIRGFESGKIQWLIRSCVCLKKCRNKVVEWKVRLDQGKIDYLLIHQLMTNISVKSSSRKNKQRFSVVKTITLGNSITVKHSEKGFITALMLVDQ